MKKIVALGAAAALVGGLFAAEPASNPSVVSFTGNASVEWGVDLDAGKTGFKNGTWTEFKIKLFDNGDKSTSGDGVWAELVMKVDDEDSCGPNGWQDGNWKGGKNAYIDVAKLHFNNIYVGIKKGDTTTGTLDFTTAIKSADPWFHPGRWLTDVGPASFTQGIVAGYEDDNFNFGVDLRSYEDTTTQYTDAYSVAAEFKLKDSNTIVEGLAAGVGASYNLSDFHFSKETDSSVKENEGYAYTLPGEISSVITQLNTAYALLGGPTIPTTGYVYDHVLGYSANVGYKLSIGDSYWLKPQVGLTGSVATYKNTAAKYDITANSNTIAAGLIFAWGDTNSYGDTGHLYFFDDDYGDKAKGTTPGISAVAYIPLPDTLTINMDDYKIDIKAHNKLKTLIVPSLYSGDLVENLKFAAYSEIGLFDYREKQPEGTLNSTETSVEYYGQTADYKNTTALAVAAGVKYDIKADDLTITPMASVRYANTCYVANKASIKIPGTGDCAGSDFFKVADLGIQKNETEGERTGLLSGDFFNLEAGVSVAGLIDNTTFSVHYKSANLLNNYDYSDEGKAEYSEYGRYNVKLGTLNVGCKIAF